MSENKPIAMTLREDCTLCFGRGYEIDLGGERVKCTCKPRGWKCPCHATPEEHTAFEKAYAASVRSRYAMLPEYDPNEFEDEEDDRH